MDPVRFTSGPQQPSPGASPTAARTRSAGAAPDTEVTGQPPSRDGAVASTRHDPASAVRVAQVSAPDLRELLEHVGDYIDPERRSLSFEIREELGRTVVSVYDADTEELVRQIPADEMIRVANVMREIAEQGEQRTAAGLLLNERA